MGSVKQPLPNKKNVISEKHERFARDYLYDLLMFQNVLDEEMQRIAPQGKNTEQDHELLALMQSVDDKYRAVMRGLRELDSDHVRPVLTIFADALQDLMTYMHRQRRH